MSPGGAVVSLVLALVACVLLLSLGGCTPNSIQRAEIETCAANDRDSGHCSIEDHRDKNYLLGFVEFDDQGIPYTRATDGRNQMDALFERMQAESVERDLCIIIFVHGWKHNAAANDTNVSDFRILLEQVAKMEKDLPTSSQREVVGIYAGWRGWSLHATPIDENLTFWSRKAAAERVGQGSVRTLLARAKAFRDALNTTNWPAKPGESTGRRRRTRMMTIGHSFGGLIVYSALAQYLTDQAAALEVKASFKNAGLRGGNVDSGDSKELQAYGDLVVIINPAIEATRYEPIREIMETRSQQDFAPYQPPAFIEVTSVGDSTFNPARWGDWATGIAFPAGRFASTIDEDVGGSFRSGEYAEALSAFGHYSDFWTHFLTNTNPSADSSETLAPVKPADECEALRKFDKENRPDGYLVRGWTRQYGNGAQLHALEESKSDPNNPYWIIRADPSIILDHGDITRGVFLDFVRHVYDDVVITKDKEMDCR
jgi:pimeloyl-ACP methyl ester carboxylesterase